MAAQNEQLNKCLTAAQLMLQKQEMSNKKTLATAKTEDSLPESKKRMQKLHAEELASVTSGERVGSPVMHTCF